MNSSSSNSGKISFYGCKVLFRINIKSIWHYEERVVLVRASTFETAIKLAELEGDKYAESIRGERLNFIQIYIAKEYDPGSLVSEVYSLMRKSNLTPDEYLDSFEDTGSECSNSIQ
jgi:hypothetical protein